MTDKVELNHIIVHSKNKVESALCLAQLFDRKPPKKFGPFMVVPIGSVSTRKNKGCDVRMTVLLNMKDKAGNHSRQILRLWLRTRLYHESAKA